MAALSRGLPLNPNILACVCCIFTLLSATLYAAPLQVTVLDGTGAPVPDAVVFLESAEASAALQAAATENAVPVKPVKIVQRHKAFIPEITIIPRGTAVTFPNEDTVRHHVYSFSPVKQFEIKLYVGTPTEPVVFEQSGVAVLGCNIHDEMIAWVVVLDTPYYASTDKTGVVKLTQVPAGEYKLRVWHKDLLSESAVPNIPISVSANTPAQRVTLPELVPMN